MSTEKIEFLINGPLDADVAFLFAHGAGAPMDTAFMNEIATGMAASGIRVYRFEFPYMAGRRHGHKRGPDRTQVLLETWNAAIEAVGAEHRLVIGGKSLGGRMATMVADRDRVDGVVCLGYPFHPPGRPETLRTAHLEAIDVPVLILQGERDPFGTPTEIASYALSPAVAVEWIPDGDHSFKPRKKSGHTLETNLALATRKILLFLGYQ